MRYDYFVLVFVSRHPVYGDSAVMRHDRVNNVMAILNRYGNYAPVSDINVPFIAHAINHF